MRNEVEPQRDTEKVRISIRQSTSTYEKAAEAAAALTDQQLFKQQKKIV